MSTICYYLCCFGCFGLCCKRRFVKKDSTHRRLKTQKMLEEITTEDETQALAIASNPLKVKTEEMTKVYVIPNNIFNTEDEIMGYLKYQKRELLGFGKFGNVYKVTHVFNKDIVLAVKMIELPERDDKKRLSRMRDVKNELFILRNARHPHIVRMVDHFMITDKNLSNKTVLYIFMQFAPEGDLSKLLKLEGPFDEKHCKIWFAQLLSALVFMHSKGIAHRDLKTANILLDESHDVLISDFGLSQVKPVESELKSKTFCGTIPFMAPELHSIKINYKSGKRTFYNAFKVDVWALGVILYNLFNKDYPFKGNKFKKLLKQMNERKWSFVEGLNDKPSQQMTAILTSMLEPEVYRRPTMAQLSRYPWVYEEYNRVQQKCNEFIKIKN